jgi:rubrerythrin
MGITPVERADVARVAMEFQQAGVIESVRGEAGISEGATAGDAAVGEFRCEECGYGVIVHRTLPPCPMCGGETWRQAPWSPFSRAAEAGRLH